MNKHVKQVLLAVEGGLILVVLMGLSNYFFSPDSENWLNDAIRAGIFYAVGVWLGIGLGIDRFNKDR